MRPPDEPGGVVIIVGAQGRIGGLLAAMTEPPYRPIAVTRRGGPVDLGQPGPAAPDRKSTRFSGPWAARVAGMMQQHGVEAAAVDGATLGREAAVKLGWICALGLLGEVHQASVGAVIDHHGPALSSLLHELHPVLVAELGLDLDPAAFAARISAYSARIRHFPARYKERRWRNEALAVAAARRGLALPQHQAFLARC